MNKLTIKLKQHTPIIHFQHEQDGATLRATEVKPKLDRFILTKLGEDYNNFTEDEKKACKLTKEELTSFEKGYVCAKHRGWLVGKGEHGALNYKMRIEGDKTDDFLLKSSVSGSERGTLERNRVNYIDSIPVFGDDMYGIVLTNICLNIFSLNKDISDKISKYICEFFVVISFGFRQSKGFGIFTVDSIIKNNIKEEVDREYLKMIKNNFKYVYQKNTNDFTNALKQINNDYKKLKAGVNFREYIKSYLFCFHQKSGIGWEKRKIKEQMNLNGFIPFSSTNRNFDRSCKKCTLKEPTDYRFVRALLGLAEHYEFNKSNSSKITVKVDGGADFERFQSPVAFKIIDNTIYLLGNPIQEAIFSRDFSFQLYKDANKIKTIIGAPFHLKTPDSFNLKEFLELCSSNLKYIKKQSL